MGRGKYLIILFIVSILLCTAVSAKPPKWVEEKNTGGVTKPITTAPTTTTVTPKTTTTITTAPKTTTTTTPKTTITAANTTASQQTEINRIETSFWKANWEAIAAIIAIIGALAGWFISWMSRNRATRYMKKINTISNSYDNTPSECETELVKLRDNLENDFTNGKLNEQSYDLLDRKLNEAIKNVRKGSIEGKIQLTDNIKKEMDDMLKDGVVSKKEYEKFKGMDLKKLSKDDEQRLKLLVRKWRNKDKHVETEDDG